MFFFSAAAFQKITVILKSLDDWNEWFLIIETMIKREKVDNYVNLIKLESNELVKSITSTFFSILAIVTSSTDLSEDQRRDLTMLKKNHKKNLRTYRKRIEALKVLNLYILISVNRMNLLYLRKHVTMFQKLLAFKKRLASIDRIRELKIVRKYKNLLRASKHQ